MPLKIIQPTGKVVAAAISSGHQWAAAGSGTSVQVQVFARAMLTSGHLWRGSAQTREKPATALGATASGLGWQLPLRQTNAIVSKTAGACALVGAPFPSMISGVSKTRGALCSGQCVCRYAHGSVGALWAFQVPFQTRLTLHGTDASQAAIFPRHGRLARRVRRPDFFLTAGAMAASPLAPSDGVRS